MVSAANEPSHPISLIVTGDGNMSLSHMPHCYESDHCVFSSDYFLDCKEVDKFASVKKHTKGKTNNVSHDSSLLVSQHKH